MEDLIDCYIEDRLDPQNIAWELRNGKGRIHDLSTEDYSVYEEHFDYLKESVNYAWENKMEPFIVLETTRGCPFGCTFCKIGTKYYQKIKTPFIKKCNCSRASTCAGAGCFETSTCITLNIFRDYDLSKIFRHYFASSAPIIHQSSTGHSSNLPEENLDSNDPSHERRHVESTSGSSTSHSSSSIVNEVRSSA